MASRPPDEIARRIAENESRFRASNEKIEDAVLRFDPDPLTVPFVCECGRPECLQTVRLSILEYEARQSTWKLFLMPARPSDHYRWDRPCPEGDPELRDR